MAVDLAIDYNTGDLVIAPNKDIDIRTGQSSVDQRIRVRLRIISGEWLLDPTEGRLGSRLRDAARLPNWRSVQEVPLMVREALEPMEDITVRDVICEIDSENSSTLNLTILYVMIDEGNVASEVLSTSLAIQGAG